MSKAATQRSRELFDGGFYCAESVLMAIAESQEIQSDIIPKIATGFCSGVARGGGMCGAVSGAIMGIGLVTGRDSPESPVQPSYELVQQLIHRFSQAHGSTQCPELIGCDLGTDEGQQTFKERHLVERCQRYVEDATNSAVLLLAKPD